MLGTLITHVMMLGQYPSKKKKDVAFKSSTESEEEHDDEEVVSSLGNSSAYLTKIKMKENEKLAIKRHPT